MDKLQFLINDFPALVRALDPSTPPVFGKMNVQQMIEHMSDSIRIANGKEPHSLHTPEERLPAMRDFVLSDKEFRPNTKNALMAEEPAKERNSSYEAALEEMEMEIRDLVRHFEGRPEHREMNPFFGPLSFSEWLHLFHKHAVHHLKQFNVHLT